MSDGKAKAFPQTSVTNRHVENEEKSFLYKVSLLCFLPLKNENMFHLHLTTTESSLSF